MHRFQVRPFEVVGNYWEKDVSSKKLDGASHVISAPLYGSALELLTAQLHRWKNVRQGQNDLILTLFDCLILIAYQMDRMGFLGDGTNSLCHLDLNHAPRNIMVDLQNSSVVAGILDWESAIFAPSFVGCTPPMWIWAWNEEEDEDERKANDEPPTSEKKKLKHLFEESVGEDFLKYAYGPQYRMARKFFEFALNGIYTNEAIREVGELLSEWSSMRDPTMEAVEDPSYEVGEEKAT